MIKQTLKIMVDLVLLLWLIVIILEDQVQKHGGKVGAVRKHFQDKVKNQLGNVCLMRGNYSKTNTDVQVSTIVIIMPVSF